MTTKAVMVAGAVSVVAADRGAFPEVARFFRRWVGWTTLGEGVGFAVAAVTGVIVATTDLSGVQAVPLLLVAGAVEGALLGAGQVLGLRGLPLPRSLLRRWPWVTSLAAVAAWAIGLLPSTLPDLHWSSPWVWVVAGLLGLVLLGTIPIAQLWLLRSALHRSWRWLPANGIGWLVGIGWTLAVSPLVDTTTPALGLVVLYAAAGVLMALTVAVTTGLCWVGWLRHGDFMADGLRPTGQRSARAQPGQHVIDQLDPFLVSRAAASRARSTSRPCGTHHRRGRRVSPDPRIPADVPGREASWKPTLVVPLPVL